MKSTKRLHTSCERSLRMCLEAVNKKPTDERYGLEITLNGPHLECAPKRSQKITSAPTLSSPGRPGSPPPELLTEENKMDPAPLPMALPCHIRFSRPPHGSNGQIACRPSPFRWRARPCFSRLRLRRSIRRRATASPRPAPGTTSTPCHPSSGSSTTASTL